MDYVVFNQLYTPTPFTWVELLSNFFIVVYLYMESSSQYPGNKVRLVSPKFPNSPNRKCLKFNYNVYGRYVGKLSILDANSVELWHRDDKRTGMKSKNLCSFPLPPSITFLLSPPHFPKELCIFITVKQSVCIPF